LNWRKEISPMYSFLFVWHHFWWWFLVVVVKQIRSHSIHGQVTLDLYWTFTADTRKKPSEKRLGFVRDKNWNGLTVWFNSLFLIAMQACGYSCLTYKTYITFYFTESHTSFEKWKILLSKKRDVLLNYFYFDWAHSIVDSVKCGKLRKTILFQNAIRECRAIKCHFAKSF